MNKLFIVIGLMLLFTACKDKIDKPNPFISVSKSQKLIREYSGRQDSILYIHRCVMQLDNDTIMENVMISEMLSDPHPSVSVYFSKTDTLIFIPVPAITGTTPEVKELILKLGNKARQIGIWYTSKEKDGGYSYRVAVYKFSADRFICLLDEQLFYLSSLGQITQTKVLEVGKTKVKGVPADLYLTEADASLQKTAENFNNGPLLIKKRNGSRQIFKYSAASEKYLEVLVR